MKFLVNANGPFNFIYTQRYFSRFSGEIVDIFEEGNYKRAIRIFNRNIVVSVKPVGIAPNQKLEVKTNSINLAEMEILERSLCRIFALDLDLEDFYKFAANDEILSFVAKKLYGYRPSGFPSLFESLVCIIISQQVNVKFALDVKGRVVKRFGSSLCFHGEKYYVFPIPESLASVSIGEFRKLRVSRQKAKYIEGLAKFFLEKKIDEEYLRKLPDGELLNSLMDIRGLGRWSAEIAMMRGFGRTGIVPAAGTGIRKAFAHYFGLHKATEEDVRRLSEKWGRHKGLAAFYLRFAYYNSMIKKGE